MKKKNSWRKNSRVKSNDNHRVYIVGGVFLFLFALTIARLFYLQVVKNDYYLDLAEGQQSLEKSILQKRGEIYMAGSEGGEMTPLVVNKRLYLLYAVPSEIKDAGNIIQKIIPIVYPEDKICVEIESDHSGAPEAIDSVEEKKEGCDYDDKIEKIKDRLMAKLNKPDDPYEPIEHGLTELDRERVIGLGLSGLYFEDEWVRYYPERENSAHLTGFWGYGNSGRIGYYGIEGYYEDRLRGQAGWLKGEKDVYGQVIPDDDTEIIEARDGVDIVTTIDKILQRKMYDILKEAVDWHEAESGSVVVMDPNDSRVLAMVNYPSFDPNNYSDVETGGVYINQIVSDSYEPGSIFKVITMAAGIDSGAVSPNDTYDDEGEVKIGKYTIRNAGNEKYGVVNMTEVLENSINTASIDIAMKVGKDRFRRYVGDFGFGKKREIDLSGVIAGDVSSLDKRGDIYLATASYGQGITVTPLDMAAAVGAIVNGGKYYEPYVVNYFIDNNGEKKYPPRDIGREVVSRKSAEIVKAMMVSVVKNGHGKTAGVGGYYLGGKTGTAEIAEDGEYIDKNIHSFVGFGTLNNPKFVVVVKLVKPEKGRYSSSTAAPAFSRIASYLLSYYGIAPDERID